MDTIPKCSVKHGFGSHISPIDGLLSFGISSAGNKDVSDRLVYKIGKQVSIYDPESGTQAFFEKRAKNVTDVIHFSINQNQKYISVCEILKHDKFIETSSHIAVYSLTTLSRVKVLTHNVLRPFSCSTFCGDPKLIAGLTDEPERLIVLWHWEKEKYYKSISLSISPNILRSGPSTSLMLSTSGNSILKFWFLGSDGNIKNGGFLAAAKESNEKFIDHVWLQSNLGLHKMIALADPDTTTENAMSNSRSRRQSIYIFEGHDLVVTSSTGNNGNVSLPPITMELKQCVVLRLDPGAKLEKIVPTSKAFMLIGAGGLICQYERTDEKQDPYVESRRLSLGDIHFFAAAVYQSEEKIVLATKSGRILNMSIDVSIDQQIKLTEQTTARAFDDHNPKFDNMSTASSVDDNLSVSNASQVANGSSSLISDLAQGGFHTSSIIAGDIAFERPLILTISMDSTARIWNYMTLKCELVHYFRNEEPLAAAFHSSGFSLLVSFKDRIRMYNVLMDKLKTYKETVLKNCKVLKFSNGSQYFAAASAVNVCVYDTKSFHQLMNFQGHMMTVTRLQWAIGDEVLFSAGMDGNVYGWPISREGRLDVISATNRSSGIIEMIVDSPSTVFKPMTKDSVEDEEQQQQNNEVNASTNMQLVQTQQKNTVNLAVNRSNLVISTMDGNLKLPPWSLDQMKITASRKISSNDAIMFVPGDTSVTITAMQLSKDRTKLYAGTSIGSLRVYNWPAANTTSDIYNRQKPQSSSGNNSNSIIPSTPASPGNVNGVVNAFPNANQSVTTPGNNVGRSNKNTLNKKQVNNNSSNTSVVNNPENLFENSNQTPSFFEIFVHVGPIVALKLCPLENVLITAGADGCVFIINLFDFAEQQPTNNGVSTDVKNKLSSQTSQTKMLSTATTTSTTNELNGDDETLVMNSEVVLMSLEDIEEHVHEVVFLKKTLNETKLKNDFQTRKVENDNIELIKKKTELFEEALNKENENSEKQRIAFEKRIREVLMSVETKDADHIKVLTELENKYEHKIADQLERYDLLSENMTLLKQKCEGLLEGEKKNSEKLLNELKEETKNREKKMKLELRRAIDEKQSNESSFKEIINQQENEYEDELKQLIGSAETELVSERDVILKLRTLVQTKNTKVDQLKKKMIELNQASKARLTLLNIEKQDKQKLLDRIEHYKKNLLERENALVEKEKIVLDLRSKNRTLENFRFVLDHRLQQLTSERGPITTHIEGLEKHIGTMYEELVEEFNLKKTVSETTVTKDQKIHWMLSDLSKTKQSLKEKDVCIATFKTDLTNIATAVITGKELEEAVKLLYKKFIKGDVANGESFVKVTAPAMEKIKEIMDEDYENSHSFSSYDMHHAGKLVHHQSNSPSPRKINSKTFLREVEEALVESAKESERQKKIR